MAAENKPANALLEARPPATDYLTYLTIIEYNLTEENLPVLHDVLQDTDLTANIGWDLIQLLLPHLPASEQCLEDIAAGGNPRECILKVTEALRLLQFDESDQDSDEDEISAVERFIRKAGIGEEESSGDVAPSPSPSRSTPAPVLQYQVLLSMLSTLHPRIKTKYPSRFLSTSLQAVLAAFNQTAKHHDELTLAAVKFIKTISGTKRPHLPPRTSTGDMKRTGSVSSAPDPEAQSEPPSTEEDTLVYRLLQSFTTHVLEDYMSSLSSEDDVPGLAWSSRLMEKFDPGRVVPHKPTYAERFAEVEALRSRSAILGQLVALAQDLGLSTDELFQTIINPETEGQGDSAGEDEPPDSAEDIPLSKTGSLFLFAARAVKQHLYTSANPDGGDTAIHIFPDHATILKNFVGTITADTAGMEPEPVLDAVLVLGLIAVESNQIGEPADDVQFSEYLRTLASISANCASPSLRYQAHYLTSTILRSHPSDVVRLTFIRDTLQHCPFQNLKASAVAWLKGETLEASMPQHHHDGEEPESSSSESVFSTPVALSEVFPFLFPDMTSSWEQSNVQISESWMDFRTELGFYLSALNFYYLLLTAEPLHENLDIAGLHKKSNIEQAYLAPMKQIIERFKQALEEGGELAIAEGDEENVGAAKMDIARVEDVIGRVETGIRKLSSS